MIYNNEQFVIIGWPEVQKLMDNFEFNDYATLINSNELMGIGDSVYLIESEWYYNNINNA